MDFTFEQKILAAVVGLMGVAMVIPDLFRLGARSNLSPRKWKRRGEPYICIGKATLPDDARLRHTHLVGATGSGKTVLMEQMIYRDLERGQGAVIIDPKGDRELYERVKLFCKSIGRENDLHLLSATYDNESVSWNPCALGNASELQTKFFRSFTYTEPHYAKACELALLQAFTELTRDKGKAFDFDHLLEQLDILTKATRQNFIEGLFLDLKNLRMGTWGDLITGRKGTRPIRLMDVIRKNEILFVDLPTESAAIQSARIGKLLLQEIILVSGLRKTYPHLKSDKPFSVYVDEFDAFAFPAFATFLNKGRSSDFMIHLAHQTLSDLDQVSPAFKGQILGNMNVRFVFRQDDPTDAETWSKFFGTKRVVKKTFQTDQGAKTGAASNREVQEFRISPDSIKELKTGTCIFSVKTEGTLAMLHVPSPKVGAKSFVRIPEFRPAHAAVSPGTGAEVEIAPDLTERCASLASLIAETKGELG